MILNESTKYILAKTFTELAIQNDLIVKCSDASDTAMEVTTFFNTIMDTIDKETGNDH